MGAVKPVQGRLTVNEDDERKHAIFMEAELRNIRIEVAHASWLMAAIIVLLALILWRLW